MSAMSYKQVGLDMLFEVKSGYYEWVEWVPSAFGG